MKKHAGFVDQPVPFDSDTEEKLEQERSDALKKLKTHLMEVKGRYYWEPGRSVSIAFALTGIPMFKEYGLDGMGGITYNNRTGVLTVNPEWHTTREKFTSYGWAPLADKMIQIVKQSPRIADIVNKSLDRAEAKLGFKIEQGVRQDIVKWCEKAAERRLAVRAFPVPKGKDFVVMAPMTAMAKELVGMAKGLVSGAGTDYAAAVAEMSDVRHLYTDYGAMKLKSKRERFDGDKYYVECEFYFDKLVYSPHWIADNVIRSLGEDEALRAFKEAVDTKHYTLKQQIAAKLGKDVPMHRIVEWKGADEFKDVYGEVTGVRYGRYYVGHGEIAVDGSVWMKVQAVRLPQIDKGVYDVMSDVELKRWIERWAESAPEEFWMDGEYRGSASARIRGLMQQWREMTPRQQEKHFAGLQRMV